MEVFLAYSAMVVSQAYGATIIGLLWGEDAKRQALTQDNDAVQPDRSYQELCAGYTAAHYNLYSDVLHTAGMLGTLMLLLAFLLSSLLFPNSNGGHQPREYHQPFRLLLWIPPVYYLTAWTGHFVFQQDIPAVFTYGTTLRGWLTGEACAWEDLVLSGTKGTREYLYGVILAVIFVYPILTSKSRFVLDRTERVEKPKQA